ncbi:hypothetical protein [Pedobacter xixiisoli]|uniref:Uncharacterized protein n=1 Tax=Pedobacter xixiisoli TaxID=1476464 RepID=A0A285ZZQ1_9SPHI|nr:hypothetical protein [Pedobacter xixiisoli]SOD15133.1 hypothetical protein SAMN06297358_2108 [Pedobacter xixiisoli]
MKELLQSVFKTTEERIKNPFIGAFFTSWIIFNWKPIFFTFFSSKNIEEKIKFIDDNFSSTNNLLIFPLIAAIFYVLVLPYISLIIDILLKHSLLKRNEIIINKHKQNIENQKQLAIEEIKLEEAKTDFRERNTHNKLVEELQKKNSELEVVIKQEKELNKSIIDELKSELNNREKMTSDEHRSFERRYSEQRREISELNSKIYEKDEELQSLKVMLNDREFSDTERLNRSKIRFSNGLLVDERYNGNKVFYYNLDTGERYDEKEIKNLMDIYSYERL